jgi:aminopeptidase N
LWIWLLIAAVGVLAACSARPADRTPGDLSPGAPTVPTPTVIGIPAAEEISPFAQYRLTQTLDPTGRRLAGTQQVTFPNHTGVELDEIVFRLYPNLPQYGGRMDIDSVRLDGKLATSSLRADDTSLAIALDDPLPPERSVTVELTFNVEIPVKQSGYVLFGQSQGIWSVPDAYPLLAVYGGAAWHEDIAPAHGDAVFAEAALYDVTLTLPPTLTLVTTGAVVNETLEANGQRAYHIAGGPLREFAWLASADYQMAETKALDVTVRSYYVPGDEAAGQAISNSAAAALRAYEDAFGPYPFQQMLVVEAPLLYYGMEFPGVNLIGLDLYRDKRAQLEDRVVHEIAHQWWYSQVGSDQVNTPWLDEGLAEYSMAMYYEQVFGEAQVNTLVNQRWLVPYQMAVENGYDAIVNQPSAAFGWEYEVIVYEKAALFFNALHDEMGDEAFKAVLRTYADRYRWRIATPEDFLAVAESVSGRDLDALYSRWILSKQ